MLKTKKYYTTDWHQTALGLGMRNTTYEHKDNRGMSICEYIKRREMASIEDANHIQGPTIRGAKPHYTGRKSTSDKKLQAWGDSTQHPTTQY